MIAIPTPDDALAVREHVLEHLSPTQRQLVPWLLLPLTMEEVATAVGYWNRTSLESHWYLICDRLELHRGHHGTARLALLRLALGMDACWCERLQEAAA